MLQNILPKQELNALARVNSVSYHSKSVHPKLVNEEISAGWVVFKKGKNSVQLKKYKNLAVTLEDRFWTLLFKLDFGYLSAEGGGKLSLNSVATQIVNKE